MMMYKTFIFCCLVMFVRPENKEGGEKHEELHSSVLHKMLKGYDKFVAPNEGKTVHDNVSVFFSHLEWSDHHLEAVFFIRQYWHDQRLEESTKTGIIMDAENIMNHIWTPDLFCPIESSRKVLEKGFIKITNGDVTWSQVWKIEVPCKTTTRDLYMNDGRVNCSIWLGSYGHTIDEVDLDWRDNARQNHVDQHLHQDVKHISYGHEAKKYLVGTYDHLTVQLEIQTDFNQEVLRFISKSALKKFS